MALRGVVFRGQRKQTNLCKSGFRFLFLGEVVQYWEVEQVRLSDNLWLHCKKDNLATLFARISASVGCEVELKQFGSCFLAIDKPGLGIVIGTRIKATAVEVFCQCIVS